MPKQAFILIDLQNDYYPDGKFPLVGVKEATENAATLLNEIRKLKDDYLIIHVRHEFPGDASQAPFFGQGTEGSQIYEGVKSEPGEIVITKNSPNSFIQTDLQKILDENKVSDIIIVGAMTHMCVQGTSRAAAEKGYKVTVIEDAVATRDLEHGGVVVPAKQVAAAVFATLAFGYASIITTKELLQSLK
ncbi:Isochorismatase-like protein [Scheffersomyces xylosifermentans]|uniref:Isochorismatase-like protein n=1 Tax=Scheffersomyces xylosifermentans TaxID=1304137 RepID=UPI00315C4F70